MASKSENKSQSFRARTSYYNSYWYPSATQKYENLVQIWSKLLFKETNKVHETWQYGLTLGKSMHIYPHMGCECLALYQSRQLY